METVNSRRLASDEALETAQKSNFPAIHYVWIGNPSPHETQNRECQNHDIAGPLMMEMENDKNPLVFWCLARHEEHYKKVFENSRIIVKNIESQLNISAVSDIDRPIFEMMKNVYNICLAESRNTIRDRVTVKDFFTLFLHLTTAGALYTFDTNILPYSKVEIALPTYTEFRYPMADNTPEIWMLYSPPNKKMIPANVFLQFYAAWRYAEDEFKINQYSEKYYSCVQKVISIFISALNDPDEIASAIPTKTESYNLMYSIALKMDGSFADLPTEFGNITKIYYNTHHKHMIDSDLLEMIGKEIRPGLEHDYKKALLALKAYLEETQWVAPKLGGLRIFKIFETKSIDVDINGVTKKFTPIVHDHWQRISALEKLPNAKRKTWQKLFVLTIHDARVKKSTGKYDDKTAEYLNGLVFIETPATMIAWIKSKQDNNNNNTQTNKPT